MAKIVLLALAFVSLFSAAAFGQAAGGGIDCGRPGTTVFDLVMRADRARRPVPFSGRTDGSPNQVSATGIEDWFSHWNFSLGLAGPYFGPVDGNDYTITLIDDASVSHTFTFDPAASPPLPFSISASLQVPVYYDDRLTFALAVDVNWHVTAGIVSGMAGGYFSVKIKPFAFFITGGVTTAMKDLAIDDLSQAGFFSGLYFGTDARMLIKGNAPPSGLLGAGAAWQMLDWLWLKLQYSFQFDSAIGDFSYELNDRSRSLILTGAAFPPVRLPQHFVTLSVGIGVP